MNRVLGFLPIVLSMPMVAAAGGIFPYPYQKETLRNGLTVIMIPVPSPGLIAYYSIVRTGSRDEVEKGKSGFAHFFEHMMFRGTKKYPGPVYDRIVTGLGADANAFTTDDFTVYHIEFAKEDLEKVIDIESDRFQNLDYEPSAFQTEAGAVYGEYRKSATDPFFLLDEKLRDLAYDAHTRLHTAPPQMKANNGIFVVDDLGRQRVSPHELMNRWIVPLDRRVDYLALNTGTKFAVPFDVHVVFSSNLAPEELVDPAFARRLGYKIQLIPMSAESYRAVVAQACARAGVPTDQTGIDYLVNTLHTRHHQPYLPSLPFDVISKIADRAHYLEEPPRMTPEVLDWAWANYFGGNDLLAQAATSPTLHQGD